MQNFKGSATRWGIPKTAGKFFPGRRRALPTGCVPAPPPLAHLRRVPLGSRRLQLPPRPEEEEKERGEPEHPQQRQRQPPRRPPHPREGWEKSERWGMKGREWGRGGRWAPPGAAGAGLGGEKGLARPPRSRRCESRAVHALQGRGGEKEEEAPAGGGLEPVPEPLAGGRCCTQTADLPPRPGGAAAGPRRCPARPSGDRAWGGCGHPGTAAPGTAFRGRRGCVSLGPPDSLPGHAPCVGPGHFPAPPSRARKDARGPAAPRRSWPVRSPSWSPSRSWSGAEARGGQRSTTHRGGSDMTGRLIYPIETAGGIQVGGI